jgi:hypothetical protein
MLQEGGTLAQRTIKARHGGSSGRSIGVAIRRCVARPSTTSASVKQSPQT